MENQSITWQRPGATLASPMLPANAPVLASLALPTQYAITNAASFGLERMLAMLERRLADGLKLVQIREPPSPERDRFTRLSLELAQRYGAKVMVKAPVQGAHGIHFTAAQLMALNSRPQGMLVAASCHTRGELERAMALELDFAVMGPVREKAGATALGWEGFRRIVEKTSIPVYAIGGVTREDLETAWRAGAHGVAMIRGAWS